VSVESHRATVSADITCVLPTKRNKWSDSPTKYIYFIFSFLPGGIFNLKVGAGFLHIDSRGRLADETKEKYSLTSGATQQQIYLLLV
jgi:hypothetical protein